MRSGRIVRVLTDPNRKEIFNCNNENRKLIISVFYPVANDWNTSKQAFYKDLYHPNEQIFIEDWKSSEDEEKYINNLTTNIYINAPIVNNSEKYPVILYSPGFNCDRDSTMFIIEKLIEEGYIVITLGSIYETDFTIMPDGEVIEMLDELTSLSSDSKEIWQELREIRKKDITFLLNQLDYLNVHDEFLKGKLDIDKIGAIGFSLGSQGVFEAAADDKRIKAVVLLEGCLHHSTVLERVNGGERTNTPHLLFKRHASSHKLRVEECYSWYENMEDREVAKKRAEEQIQIACTITKTQKALYEYINGFKSFIKINHSTHMTFSDIPMLQNQEYAECLGGQLSIKKAYEIIKNVTVRFFDEFLKNKVNEYQNFINNENTYSELEKINADGEIIMKNRLILIEGIPGSGKTTIARKVKEYFEGRGEKVKLFSEGDAHPADMAWNAYIPIDEYELLLKNNVQYEEVIKEHSSIEEDYALVAYTKLGLTPGENGLMEYFENHEVYDGRVTLDTFTKLHLNRWQQFGDNADENTIVIFECAYLQNHVNELMGFYNKDVDFITDYLKRLIKTVEKLNTKLIYLAQPDISETIDRVAKERVSPDKTKWQDWIDLVIKYVENSKYGRVNQLKGFQGVIDFFEGRKKIELAVVEKLPIEKAIINNSEYNWGEVLNKVLAAIEN